MASGFTTTGSDFDAQFIRREFFQQGTLWTWGQNNYGTLGTNNTTNRSSPVQTVAWGLNWLQTASGRAVSTGIKSDGTLWTWGQNDQGQLGDNSTTNQSSPVQTVSAGTNWRQVTAGYAVAAIKTDGTLWTWGKNTYGNLGTNDRTNRSSPVQTVAAGTNWQSVNTVSTSYTMGAIKTDGTLWMWGLNNYGQLGDNTRTDKSSPVQTVAAGTNWRQVSAGYSTAAIKTDGTLWVWGRNDWGELGTNDTTRYSSPVQTVAGGSNWKQVAMGSTNFSAIKTDGTLWVCGKNSQGQLGDNTRTDKSSPVQTVAGGTNWKQVSQSYARMGAVKTDGSLWMWGYNNYGQLGTNNTTKYSSPVQTVAGGTSWKQVSCGYYTTIAITTVN